MRKLGSMIAAIVAAMLFAAAVTATDAAPRRAPVHGGGGFDGIWSVSIVTSYGNCGSLRYSVRIAGGRVESMGDYSLSGYVSPSGGVSVTVSSGLGSASGSGRLHGSSGGGRWRSSGGECSGSWYASRR